MYDEEQGRKSKLDQARHATKTAKNLAEVATTGSPMAALSLAKDALSFRKKISEHWMILFAAVIFDIFGMIPIIGELFDLAFGLILWLYFGSKKKPGQSDLLGIVLPEFIGSAVRLVVSILPVNVATALIRIAMS
jgi:hypothetical protein